MDLSVPCIQRSFYNNLRSRLGHRIIILFSNYFMLRYLFWPNMIWELQQKSLIEETWSKGDLTTWWENSFPANKSLKAPWDPSLYEGMAVSSHCCDPEWTGNSDWVPPGLLSPRRSKLLWIKTSHLNQTPSRESHFSNGAMIFLEETCFLPACLIAPVGCFDPKPLVCNLNAALLIVFIPLPLLTISKPHCFLHYNRP